MYPVEKLNIIVINNTTTFVCYGIAKFINSVWSIIWSTKLKRQENAGQIKNALRLNFVLGGRTWLISHELNFTNMNKAITWCLPIIENPHELHHSRYQLHNMTWLSASQTAEHLIIYLWTNQNWMEMVITR